jgi:hypothetical protein
MGQTVGVMSAVTSAKNPGYKLNLRAVEYLAALPSDEYSNVFALRIDTETEGVYYHEFDSEDYAGTVRSYEEGKPEGTRCMYYVPWADGNYCIFYDLGDKTQTVCVIDLANTGRVADICGSITRSLPIENIIDMAQQLFENDSGSEGEDNEGKVQDDQVDTPANDKVLADTPATLSNDSLADKTTDHDSGN